MFVFGQTYNMLNSHIQDATTRSVVAAYGYPNARQGSQDRYD